jgi:hypothetical protein
MDIFSEKKLMGITQFREHKFHEITHLVKKNRVWSVGQTINMKQRKSSSNIKAALLSNIASWSSSA